MKHTESGSRGDMQKDEREKESKTVNRSTEGGKIRKEREVEVRWKVVR